MAELMTNPQPEQKLRAASSLLGGEDPEVRARRERAFEVYLLSICNI
jgi:hypothetical protein